MKTLFSQLRKIDGKGYPLYKQIKGVFDFTNFKLQVIHVQGDPFAEASRIEITINNDVLGIEDKWLNNHSRRTGVEDGILRSLVAAASTLGRSRGSGNSGLWKIFHPGQEMLVRSACSLSPTGLVIRMGLGLPAAGRRILGQEALIMLEKELVCLIKDGVFNADRSLWWANGKQAEDQDSLRVICKKKFWVGFIANGSLLARASGIDDAPLVKGGVTWQSPREMDETVELPNAGPITGTPISAGVTLICGGGYHGKSTLLQALARGVYNHIPGDGREYCVSQSETVAIRAEDGRGVSSVTISPFINNLPIKKSTIDFSTPNASGSTSQAANIMEALEVGATGFLIDEDTSATNFMIRDRRMQELVHSEKEPITPFIDRVSSISKNLGVSSVIVIGGSGDYFEVADRVIMMDEYRPYLKTKTALEIAGRYPSQRMLEDSNFNWPKLNRRPQQSSFDPRQGKRAERVRCTKTRYIEYGAQEIEISQLQQLIDAGQTRTLGDWLIQCSRSWVSGKVNIAEICDLMEAEVKEKGFVSTLTGSYGDRVICRRFELAATINRLRCLKISTQINKQ